jgi:type I restriction enzyme, S subunit
MGGNGHSGICDSWETHRLDKVATIIDSLHKTPAYSEYGLPMVRVTDIKGGFLDLSGTLKVTDDVFEEFTRRHRPERGDIVFSRVGTYGNASYVASDAPFCLGQNTALIHPSMNSRFLHYCLQSPAVREQIECSVVGSTQKTISLKSISALQIPVPPHQELEAIAHILGTLDDKIELNRRMNETLEAMGRALFKSWFVDFDAVHAKAEGRDPVLPKPLADLFPDSFEDSELGEIPKGWEVKTIGDIADVVGGSTPSTKEPAYWEEGAHAWATPKDLSALSVPVLLDTERRITGAGLAQISSGLLPKGTVLLSSRAPIGYLAVAEIPVAINQGFIAMKPKAGTSNLFLLLWASVAHDEIVSRANGSTFLEISKANFRPIPVVRPSSRVMKAFERHVGPAYRRIVESACESRTLAALRDTLLPKLISGELRVKDVRHIWERTAV